MQDWLLPAVGFVLGVLVVHVFRRRAERREQERRGQVVRLPLEAGLVELFRNEPRTYHHERPSLVPVSEGAEGLTVLDLQVAVGADEHAEAQRRRDAQRRDNDDLGAVLGAVVLPSALLDAIAAPSSPAPDPSPSYDPGPSYNSGGGDSGGGGSQGEW